MKAVSVAAVLALALVGCRTTGSDSVEGSEVKDASAQAAQATTRQASSLQNGEYRLTLFNFQYGVATFTPAAILNPAIDATKIRVRSPDCNLKLTAYAKKNVPAFGFFTMNPMSAEGGSTSSQEGSLWGYSDSPIRALQFLVTQQQAFPVAPVCTLIITSADGGNDDDNNNPQPGQCISQGEVPALINCLQTNDASNECQILKLRQQTYGLCN